MKDRGEEPVEDDEILFRRIPRVYYDEIFGLSDEAFAPHRERDVSGISLTRGKYCSAEEVAANPRGSSYYVAEFSAGDLRSRGISVEARPVAGNPGHVELPDLRAELRKTDECLRMRRILATELCRRVVGPFS